MKIIEQAEAEALLLVTNSREIQVSGRLKMLKPGQALVIERSEWKAKYSPSRIARRLEKQHNIKFRTGRLPANQGWLLQRVG